MIKACDCSDGAWYPLLGAREGIIFASCGRCYGHTALGQSDEKPVAIEVRAAEIAANEGPGGCHLEGEMWPDCESCGWVDGEIDICIGGERNGWHTGWLARIIYDHANLTPSDIDRAFASVGETVAEVRALNEPSGVRLKGQP